jgi:tetratricopeptide (TPR) repeat protein
MKFCPWCGTSQDGPKPQNTNQGKGVSLGDKNVIAGDIIAGKEDYNISGNATFVNNQDESSSVVKCAVCGKRMKIIDSFECPKCHAEVCNNHFHQKSGDCEVCNPLSKSGQENHARANKLADEGHQAYLNSKDKEAVSCFNKAIELDPGNYKAYTGLADVYNARGEYDEALICANKAMELNPKYIYTYIVKSYVYINLGKRDEAFQSISKALSLQPNSTDAQRAMGSWYETGGEYDKAIRSYQKAYEIDPQNYRAVNKIGWVYLIKNEFNECLQYQQKSLQIKPDYVEALYTSAICYYYLDQLDNAISILEKMINQYPDYIDSYWMLATCLKDKNDNVSALEYLKIGKDLDPHNVNILTTYAQILLDENQIDESLAVLNNVLEINPLNEIAKKQKQELENLDYDELEKIIRGIMTQKGYSVYSNYEEGKNNADLYCFGPNSVYLVNLFVKDEAWEALDVIDNAEDHPIWTSEKYYMTSPAWILNEAKQIFAQNLMVLGNDADDNDEDFFDPDFDYNSKNIYTLSSHDDYRVEIKKMIVVAKGTLNISTEAQIKLNEEGIKVVKLGVGNANGATSLNNYVEDLSSKPTLPEDVLNTLGYALVDGDIE